MDGGDEPRRAEGISITESTGRGAALSTELSTATGASVFDFHGSHRRKLIILRRKGHRERDGEGEKGRWKQRVRRRERDR